MTFARSQFELGKLQEDGNPLKAHLESLWRQTGNQPEELRDLPALPELASHVWGFFCDMTHDRVQPDRITAQIMQGYEWIAGVRLELWERKAIRLLDQLFYAVQGEK